MKRIILLPIIVALLVFSCKDKDKEKPRAGVLVPDEADAGFSEAYTGSGGGIGYIMRVQPSLMALIDDTGSESDKTKWVTYMGLGDRVTIGEPRRATWEGTVYNFTEVRTRDGKEGLAFTSQVVVGGRLAVVVAEKAGLFRSARTLDTLGTTLPQKTLVVVFPETENEGFIEIRTNTQATGPIQHYMRVNTLSERDADVQSAILLQTAEALGSTARDKARREEMLIAALEDYPTSVFSAEIAALVSPPTTAAVSVPTEPVSDSRMFVNDTNVNVRDVPDTVTGKVTGQLNTGDEVTVDLQTVNTTTIDGYSAPWYHITKPREGWVFGQFLGFGN